MAYIRRDNQGNITGVFAQPHPDASEYLSPQTAELLAYLGQSAKADEAQVMLNSSDLALIRVLEDLINTLVDKGVIVFTDLPPAAREKLVSREKIRDHLNNLDNLIGEDEGIL